MGAGRGILRPWGGAIRQLVGGRSVRTHLSMDQSSVYMQQRNKSSAVHTAQYRGRSRRSVRFGCVSYRVIARGTNLYDNLYRFVVIYIFFFTEMITPGALYTKSASNEQRILKCVCFVSVSKSKICECNITP
jgi:hypothetical protein